MSWKVSVERVKLFPHPGTENLMVARVGLFQLVIRKGNLSDGQLVAFAPKRSILPEELRGDYQTPKGGSYLSVVSPDFDPLLAGISCRVSSFPLVGVESEGVTISTSFIRQVLGVTQELSLEEMVEKGLLEIGVDISNILGIRQYQAVIPEYMKAKYLYIPPTHIRKHDVESGILYGEEFQEGEEVEGTEKIHGSQMGVVWVDDQFFVSTKNLIADDLAIKEDEDNIYWKSLRTDNYFLRDFLRTEFKGVMVQIFSEVIPCQKKYSYGFTQNFPVYRIFRMEVNHERLSKKEISLQFPVLNKLMTPKLYTGPYNEQVLKEKANQQEQVSGKQLHNSEGIVVEPVEPRKSSAGFDLYVKFLNKKFKSNDDDLS